MTHEEQQWIKCVEWTYLQKSIDCPFSRFILARWWFSKSLWRKASGNCWHDIFVW